MLQKDKLKIYILGILVLLLAGAYMIYGKESVVMKYVSGFCLIAWLATMFLLNRKYR